MKLEEALTFDDVLIKPDFSKVLPTQPDNSKINETSLGISTYSPLLSTYSIVRLDAKSNVEKTSMIFFLN